MFDSLVYPWFQRNHGNATRNTTPAEAATAFESWLTTSSRPPFVPGAFFSPVEGGWARGAVVVSCCIIPTKVSELNFRGMNMCVQFISKGSTMKAPPFVVVVFFLCVCVWSWRVLADWIWLICKLNGGELPICLILMQNLVSCCMSLFWGEVQYATAMAWHGYDCFVALLNVLWSCVMLRVTLLKLCSVLFHFIVMWYSSVPVVPHKAVAKVSK